MLNCPYCRNDRIEETIDRGIHRCDDCGAEFRDETVFKEGSYRTFMENVLNKVAGSMEPRTADMIIRIRNNALNDKNEIDSIVEKLMDIAESVNVDNVVGQDRKQDVIDIVESIEKISAFAKALAQNNEISERTAYRMAILEGVDPESWMYPAGEIPDLPGEISDEVPPSASDIVTAQEPPVPAGSPAVDKVWQEGNWMGEKVKFNVVEEDGKVKYTVCKMDETPIISYNEETGMHDGLDQFSEEQLAELDTVMSEFNKDVMKSMSHQYGADKAKQIYYATANKQDRDPEDFHKVDEQGEDMSADAEGTVVSTETNNPAEEAEALSAPMIQQGAADVGSVDEGAKSVEDKDAAGELHLYITNDGQLYRQQHEPIIKNLLKKIKRGVYDSDRAVEAFAHLAYSGAKKYIKEFGGDISTFSKATRLAVARALRDEFEDEYVKTQPTDESVPSVDGPVGSPDVQSDPAVDGPVGEPVVGESAPEVDGPVGQPVDGTCQVDGPVGEPVVDENDEELAQINGVIEPEVEVDPEAEAAAKEAEEAEAEAVEEVSTKAEKAQDKIETAEKAIEDLKAAVEELTKLEQDESEADEEGVEVNSEEGEADDFGEEEPEANDTEKIEEMEKKKTKSGFDLVEKPKAVPAKREVDGSKPSGHVVGYVQTNHDPSKPPSEQWTEEEAPIPFTQAEAEKGLVDEEGEKVKKPDYSNTKDADEDKLDKKTFEKGHINAKKPTEKVEETTRFNGFRLGDKIKVPGYSRSFELKKIELSPTPRFHLSEGRVSITLDANNDQFELDEDRDIRWQRTTSIIEDTRTVWESMEKEMINEGCAGGVCTIGSPLSVQNATSGLGSVASAMPMFTKTPIRTIPHVASDKEIYAYIKNNSLHTIARETALGQIKGNFMNTESDVEKIYEDAVASSKFDGREDAINEVDSSYEYETQSNRSVDVQTSINEGYEKLKELGIL